MDTEAARLAAAASPSPMAVDTLLVVPTLIKTQRFAMPSTMAQAGPMAARSRVDTAPTAAVSMSDINDGPM